MILTLTKTKEANLIAFALFNCSLLAFRIAATLSLFYGFLLWNLVLAGVPFIVSYIMEENPKWIERKFPFYLLSFVWLLFLPNAPYIITDFLHFKRESDMPEWFDVLLLTSFSFNGIALGLLSMNVVFQLWEQRFDTKKAWNFIFISSMLSGFGIYIGRFLRFNSWDIITNPIGLMFEIPFVMLELKAIGFSIGYGLFVFLFYSFFKINSKSI